MLRRDLVRIALGLTALLSAASFATADSLVTTFASAEIRPSLATNGTDNGTIGNALPSGIRQFAGNPNGTSDLFFNIEGTSNGDFRTFSVADFRLPAVPGATAADLNRTRLQLFEAPAAFGAAGPIEVYLLGATASNLISVANNPSSGTPQYQGNNNGLASIDPVFSPFSTLLGTATFTPRGAGAMTEISLTFTGAAQAAFLTAVQTGGIVRFGVAPGNASVAATFGGLTNNNGAPRLSVVPGPASLVLGGLGVIGVAVIARVRRARVA
jgi:hypothetical protein